MCTSQAAARRESAASFSSSRALVGNWLSRLAAGLLFLGFFSISGGPTRAAAPPIRIMPLGDSITYGCCIPMQGGYRGPLYQLLTSAGYNVDFVGTLNDEPNSLCCTIPNPALPDTDSEGHGGALIGDIEAGITGWLDAVESPDLVLLYLGTNDYSIHYDTAHAIDRLKTLIARILALRPYTRILVGNLLLRTDSAAIDQNVQTTFNSFVPGLANNRVTFVDLRSWVGPADLADGLHPNASGYAQMASAWFAAISNLVSPTGTTDTPALVGATGQVNLRQVTVQFSKPVEDAAANPAHFVLSGAVKVIRAELDASKRIITLTTSEQAANALYALWVNGVYDRTSQRRALPAGSSVIFRSGPVAEAARYNLIYSLRLPAVADYNLTGVPYEIDNRASAGAFSRIAYYLELQPVSGPLQYVWVSMDAFTSDPGKMGVPTFPSGAFFQQPVAKMNIRSSVPGVVTGNGLAGGNIEFWGSNYAAGNSANVPGGSGSRYDWGDSATLTDRAGYGSMQVHNWASGQTVFAFNGWGAGPESRLDVGIGNQPGGSPDWTLAGNAGNYKSGKLQVYVLPARFLSVYSSNPNSGAQIRLSTADQTGARDGATPFTRYYAAHQIVHVSAALTAGGATFRRWLIDGADYGTSPRTSISMDSNHRLTAIYVPTRVLTVTSSNPGTGVTIRVGPADNQGAGNGTASFIRHYAEGTVVTLAAPVNVSGKPFRKWQRNGADYSTNPRTSLALFANQTMTAVYGP